MSRTGAVHEKTNETSSPPNCGRTPLTHSRRRGPLRDAVRLCDFIPQPQQEDDDGERVKQPPQRGRVHTQEERSASHHSSTGRHHTAGAGIPPALKARKCPSTTHAAQPRLKGKRRDPDAPFSHRARFSKLKRAIVQDRRSVFDSLAASILRGHDMISAFSSRTTDTSGDAALANHSDHDDNTAAPPSRDASSSSTASCTTTACHELLRGMTSLVSEMELVYIRLHQAMRRKDYMRAGSYIHYIRRLKRRLHRAALKWRTCTETGTSAVDVTVGSTVKQHMSLETLSTRFVSPVVKASCEEPTHSSLNSFTDETDAPNFMNFYPSIAKIGAGGHPLAALIDQRSGGRRNLKRLNRDEIHALRDITLDTLRVEALPASHRVGGNYVASYCRNVLTDALDDLVFTILQKQYHLQSALKKEKPLQFKARRMYSTGLRETLKGLRAFATRIPLVLVAADIEITTTSSLEDTEHGNPEGNVQGNKRRSVNDLGVCGTIDAIRSLCILHNIPFIACMTRHHLAYALFAKGCKISSVLLHSAEGVYEEVRVLRHYSQQLCDAYTHLASAGTIDDS